MADAMRCSRTGGVRARRRDRRRRELAQRRLAEAASGGCSRPLEIAGVRSDEAFMVGDRLGADVWAARQVGLRAVLPANDRPCPARRRDRAAGRHDPQPHGAPGGCPPLALGPRRARNLIVDCHGRKFASPAFQWA
ncbi:MAG TPA: hypothetical protein DCK98_07985 [Chloroflexi bacterium]|nr:hypothetical protein [Chloroflexota bacterium]HAL28792.1 hypothetical protein [Chloroflexota bacterium]